MATVPTPAPSAAPEAQAPVNHFGRLFGVLVSPKATFADIVRKPTWILPLVFLTIISLAITAIFASRVGWEKFMARQIEKSPQAEQLSPEQRQEAIEQQSKFVGVFAYIASGLGHLIITLLMASVLFGAFNVFAGAGVRFLTAMGIVAHALMPGVVGGLLGILILFLKDPDAIDLENLVGSNLSVALADEAPKWLVSLASSLDLFSFWIIFLLAVGFAAANPRKVSQGKALGIILAVWAVYVLGKTGIAALFS